MNLEKARFNMVEQQIRPWNVLDTDVLDLLMAVKREEFVPQGQELLAFADIEIPLGHGATMMAPKIEGHVMQAVQVKKSDKVLEIGTGSGFLTALLATKADRVLSLDIVPELAASAKANLDKAGLTNVQVDVADGAAGAEAQGPFDVIVLGASVAQVPQALLDQLKPGGRLFAVVGQSPCQSAVLMTCTAPGVFKTDSLFETVLQPLVNAPKAAGFVF